MFTKFNVSKSVNMANINDDSSKFDQRLEENNIYYLIIFTMGAFFDLSISIIHNLITQLAHLLVISVR